MADESTKKPQLEIHSDEDWKERVKAEDARLDTERAKKPASAVPSETAQAEAAQPKSAEHGTAQAAESMAADIDPSLLPPAEFAVLVEMFSTQAMVALGLLPDPASGQPEVRPVLARHYIDMLGVLEQKTKGNLTKDEQRLLDSSLHQLRLVYVEYSRGAPQTAGTA